MLYFYIERVQRAPRLLLGKTVEKLFSGAHPHYHLDEGTIQRSKTDDKKLYLNNRKGKSVLSLF